MYRLLRFCIQESFKRISTSLPKKLISFCASRLFATIIGRQLHMCTFHSSLHSQRLFVMIIQQRKQGVFPRTSLSCRGTFYYVENIENRSSAVLWMERSRRKDSQEYSNYFARRASGGNKFFAKSLWNLIEYKWKKAFREFTICFDCFRNAQFSLFFDLDKNWGFQRFLNLFVLAWDSFSDDFEAINFGTGERFAAACHVAKACTNVPNVLSPPTVMLGLFFKREKSEIAIGRLYRSDYFFRWIFHQGTRMWKNLESFAVRR